MTTGRLGKTALAVRSEVLEIDPLDELESVTQTDILAWIDSGVELCRLAKPATPAKHLVSYFMLVDRDHLLLVDHINAGLWLPTGGHVEPGEHPRETAMRELREELGLEGEFLQNEPLLLTSTVTVGKTAGHTDVSLWYVFRGDRSAELIFDDSEFRSVRWFHRQDLPLDRTDPELHRFVEKLYSDSSALA